MLWKNLVSQVARQDIPIIIVANLYQGKELDCTSKKGLTRAQQETGLYYFEVSVEPETDATIAMTSVV